MPEPDMLQQVGLYCLMSHSLQELAAPLSNLLQRDSYLLVQDTPRAFKRSFQSNEAVHIERLLARNIARSYFFDDSKAASTVRLPGLLKDVKRLHLGRGQQICVILEEPAFFRSGEAELRQDLSTWKRFCEEFGHRVLFLIHGPYDSLRPLLNKCNALLMGLASHNQNHDDSYSLNVDFWHLPHNVLAHQEWLLHCDPDQFLVTSAQKVGKHNIGTLKNAVDSEKLFTLTELSEGLYPLQHIIAAASSNLELIASLDKNITAATVMLACHSAREIDELATLIYQLRCQAGDRLKLIVRETHRCLRSADEIFLLSAGCNLIIPHNVTGARLRNMISATQGMVFKRKLPPTLSKMNEIRPHSRLHGYCEPHSFVRYAQRALGSTRQGELSHLLIQLKPLTGISLEQTLGLCQLRRDGDLLTIANEMVYLFLYACSIDDLDAALRDSMELPVNDIFSVCLAFHQSAAIIDQLKSIDEAETIIATERARELLEQHEHRAAMNPESASRSYRIAKRHLFPTEKIHES